MLTSGSRLGPYEVVGRLGAGGMGEVYRARDDRLSRDVAIKILPPLFAADPERLSRFRREAQVLASLNHPHIASIYGVEDAGGLRALVLELVDGETLAERIAAGPLPVEEALDVARQIADALDAAHERGIVHRDLKPANVKRTPAGTVKLLDFGLAKAMDLHAPSADAATSPTITAAATEAGVVIGTAAYMSPEQARGKAVDRRADVWSFGVVLFEMLAGRRLFDADNVSDILAAVLRADPDWTLLPPDTPPAVRRLLARCLQRDRKQRLRDIGDARLEIEEAFAQMRSGAASTAAPVSAARLTSRPVAVAFAALVLVAAGFTAGRVITSRAVQPAPAGTPIRSVVNLPPGTFLAGWASPVLAISADGSKVAYVATSDEHHEDRLYVHHLDRGETQLVPESATAEGPFFAADGQWVAFATDVSLTSARTGQLKKFSLATGLTQPVVGIPDYAGGDWAADGSIFLTPTWTSGLWKVPGNGGQADKSWENVRIGDKQARRALFWPQLLPGGSSALVIDGDASITGEAAVVDLVQRTLHPTGISALFARYSPTGHLLALRRDGSVHALPFDARRARGEGAGVAVLKDVAVGANGAPALALSAHGTLVYATGYLRASGRELLKLSRVSFSGEVRPLPFEPDTFVRVPRPSPDGRRIANSTWDGTIWIHDVARGVRARLPRGATENADFLAWSPDGERVAFVGITEGHAGYSVMWQKADGSGPPEVLIGGGSEKATMCFTPDGRYLLYRNIEQPDAGLWMLDVREKTARRMLEVTSRYAAVSPDGQWIAYDSGESGTYEVYARRFPTFDRKVQLSVGGGGGPHWSADGKAVYYYLGDRMRRVRTPAGERLEPSRPESLFTVPGLRSFSVVPDGSGFYATVRAPDSGIVRQLHLVTNWFDELQRLAPSGGGR